jgi:hypothetical protein
MFISYSHCLVIFAFLDLYPAYKSKVWIEEVFAAELVIVQTQLFLFSNLRCGLSKCL